MTQEQDLKIIALTTGLDPASLTAEQRRIAAEARLREAKRREVK